MDRIIRNFVGDKLHIVCDKSDVMDVAMNELVNPFIEDLNHSLDSFGAKGYEPSLRAKNYLSYIASVIIAEYDGDDNILSDRTMRRRQQRETSLDQQRSTTGVMSGAAKPGKAKRLTQIQRMDKFRRQHPDVVFRWCRVATDGSFELDGICLKIVDGKYAGRHIKGFDGTYYNYDRVLVADYGKRLRKFFDQSVEELDPEHIFVIEDWAKGAG